MDDIVIRSKYPRHSVSGRKKKRHAVDKNGLNFVITRQIIISLLILTIAFAAKYVSTPIAKIIEEKIKYTLTQDIDINNILASIDNLLGKNNDAGQSDQNEDNADKQAVDSGTEAIEASTSSNGNDGSIAMLTVPVNGTISSMFGERIDSLTGDKKIHEGIDIEAEKGASIKAALGGTVLEARNSKTYGKYIKISHTGGLVTVYAHCSVVKAVEGQKVKQGEIIAEVGNTGASLGDHLHFEIWKNGKAVNPLDYVSFNKE